MSQHHRTVNHCDVCGHEWIPKPGVVYTHCTSGKCRSRKWNTAGGSERIGRHMGPNPGQDLDSGQVTGSAKPDMQALRDICAGNLPNGAIGFAVYDRLDDPPIMEIPICGKTWWEEGEQYECLMDKGHREAMAGKHGLRGMVRRLEE